MITTTSGAAWSTSRANRERISSLRSPLTPQLRIRQSGCVWPSQYPYWLSAFPAPARGASRGDRNPAVAVSALGGYLLYHAANQEWLDGPLALIAAISVTWMVVHMWRTGRRMKGDIEGRLQSSSVKPGAAAFAGVFLFTLLMISREGIETALLLMQLRETVHLVLGAALGIAGAAAVAWMWSRYGHRINLALFFQATAIFLFVFVVQLVIKGTHEMAEQH